MELKEINLNSVHDINKKLNEEINYDFDLIVFVARGSYIIGADLSKFRDVPLLEIKCSRIGKIIKNSIKPLIRYLPNSILLELRKKELQKRMNPKKALDNVDFEKDIFSKYKERKRILLVDDSIDTGNTIKECEKALHNYFENSEVKSASLNVMLDSQKYPNYFLYADTMLRGPWSSDSKENKQYMLQYKTWKDNYLR